MYTIENKIEYELMIKNSRFIALLYPIHSLSQVNPYLTEAKIRYPKATHYTYAYRIDDNEKSSDDGEPGGTAGLPILNVLQKQEMTQILVIVIRYFGGIKLGAGGLVRAYSKACKESLDHASILQLVPAKKVLITTNYNKTKELDYLLRDKNILKKEFTDSIIYTVLLENENILEGHFSYRIIDTGYITEKKEKH